MAGTLRNPPADIIRWLLIDLGLGTKPSVHQDWPIQYSQKPNVPDNMVWLLDSVGTSDGDTQPDGEMQSHYGFQILLRATDDLTGWFKMNQIFIICQSIERKRLTIDNNGSPARYLIDNVSKLGNIIPLGSEPESKRVLFSLNAATTLRQLS